MEAIIATKDQQGTLLRTLRCLERIPEITCAHVGNAGKPIALNIRKAHEYLCPADGFAANVNRLLRKCTSEHVLLLGSDVYITQLTIDALRGWATGDTIASATPANTGTARNHWHSDDKPQDTWMFGGNLSLIPLKFQRQHDLWFDESLYCYGEDTDFGLRWINAGGHITHLPRSYAFHDHDGYFNTHGKHDKYYYLTRNLLHVGMRHKRMKLIALALAFIGKPGYFDGINDFMNNKYGQRT